MPEPKPSVCDVRPEFDVHLLNDMGVRKATRIAVIFSRSLEELETVCGADGREMAIVRTKLQEACFFAKRAMAANPENNVGIVGSSLWHDQ